MVVQCSMPCCRRRWIPPSMAGKMVPVPVAPGCVYFGFSPSSLSLTHATSASEMQWASMAMHYTSSLPIIQADSDGVVKYDNKKQQYKCTCNEKVRNYPVFARVRCIIYASAIRMARTQHTSFTHANERIYVPFVNGG